MSISKFQVHYCPVQFNARLKCETLFYNTHFINFKHYAERKTKICSNDFEGKCQAETFIKRRIVVYHTNTQHQNIFYYTN